MGENLSQKRINKLLLDTNGCSDPAEVYNAVKKLRTCLTDKFSVLLFQKDNGLQNLIVLLKRFGAHLASLFSRKLIHRSYETESSTSQSNAEENIEYTQLSQHLTKLVNEIIALLANCFHLEPTSRAIVRSSHLLQILLSLLQITTLPQTILSSILRLLGNVVESSEFALCILQTRFMVAALVQWLNKLTSHPVELMSGREPEASLQHTHESSKKCAQLKTIFLALRLFRRLTLISSNFVRFLLQNDLSYHLAKCMNPQDPEHYQDSEEIRDKVVELLLNMAPCQDPNFAEQLVRAQVFEELMNLVRKRDIDFLKKQLLYSNSVDPNLNRNVKTNLLSSYPIRDLLLASVKWYSDARIDMSKFGTIEYFMALVSLKNPSFDTLSVSLLCRFCRDAFTRVKLRETGALNILINEFERLVETEQDRDLIADLIFSFTCFLYDECSLDAILKWKSELKKEQDFVNLLASVLSKFVSSNRCTTLHTCKGLTGNKQETDGNLVEESHKRKMSAELYRPDSPTYKRLKRNYSMCEVNKKQLIDDSETCLCKDFTKTDSYGSSDKQWNITNQGLSGFSPHSSPGACWSPTNSTYGATSPGQMSTSSVTLDSEALSPDDNEHLSEFNKSEWFSDLAFAQNVTKSPQAPSLCSCPSSDQPSENLDIPTTSQCNAEDPQEGSEKGKICGEQKYKQKTFFDESSINYIVLFLSALSHNERFAEHLVIDSKGNLLCKEKG